MEGSVQTEQALLEELHQLRARVVTLEQTEAQLRQAQEEQNHLLNTMLETTHKLETLQKALQASETALLEANRHMDKFLSIASHELRTPLTTIKGNIQLAKRHLTMLYTSDGEDFTEKLDLIQELLSRADLQVRVQNRLVGDLLDVSRIQANRMELHTANYNLLDIVRETVEKQQIAAPLRSITLDLPERAVIPIDADKTRIEQVITNYLTNALKYSASDKPVEVRIEMQGHNVCVSVEDKGPGLPLGEQKQLWQRFYRVPGVSVQSGSGVGLGIGLYICRTIIEHHHGQVGVQSTVGSGSTFWFTLPTRLSVL